MWAALLAAAVLAAPRGELSARIAASAAAAEALQGPLDGGWVLYDRHGRVLYGLQITNPAGGGPPRAAWSAHGATAPVESMWRSGPSLSLHLDGARIRLHRHSSSDWTGAMTARGHSLAVTLRRAP